MGRVGERVLWYGSGLDLTKTQHACQTRQVVGVSASLHARARATRRQNVAATRRMECQQRGTILILDRP